MNPETSRSFDSPELSTEKTSPKEQSEKQKAALKMSVAFAKRLQMEYPQIAEDFLSGDSFSQIDLKYGISQLFGLTGKNMAENAIRIALTGFQIKPGVTGMENITGLIDNETYNKHAKLHQQRQGSLTGIKTKIEGTGIFGMTDEQRRELGKKSAAKLLENKAGVFGLSKDQLREYGIQALASRGYKAFSDDERDLISSLRVSSNFTKNSKASAIKIADELNRKFHDGKQIRNARQISKFLYRHK